MLYATFKTQGNLVRKIRGYIDYLEHNAAFETEFYDVGDRVAVSKKR